MRRLANNAILETLSSGAFREGCRLSQRNHACLASTIFSIGLERRGDIARFLLSFYTKVGLESSRMSMTALFHCNRDFGGNFKGNASNFDAMHCIVCLLHCWLGRWAFFIRLCAILQFFCFDLYGSQLPLLWFLKFCRCILLKCMPWKQRLNCFCWNFEFVKVNFAFENQLSLYINMCAHFATSKGKESFLFQVFF